MERGGYRLIRMLSSAEGDEVSLCAGPDDEPVVLRIVREGPADAAVAASAAASPHLAQLLDLFSLPEDRFGLVYPRIAGGTLARVLARRSFLEPGEASTILVSVVRALAALHAAGCAHGALIPSGVLFDAAGTPVLADLTACVPATEVSRSADLRAFAVLAAAVLSRVRDSEPLLTRITASEATLEDIEAALFDAAEPRPVELPAAEAPTIEQLLPSRSPPPADPAPPSAESPGRRRIRAAVARIAEAARALRTVRRRVWVPAVLVAAGLVAALLLVPGGGTEAPGEVPPPTPSESAQVAPPPDPAVAADDPVAAAVALAVARDACLVSTASGCLERVDQPGSALLEEDLAGVGPPPPTLPDPGASATVQRTGDAALVTVGDVRLLLVRVDKEWRLRDVFAAEPPSP
ncbi:hypothetical protein [Naasia sp. SYSU D00948]|uniref:hypothetical protein n=1 Tax=Naasia sp. SYSU D00948 TaxID=2817379 RepID=UPI001B30F7F2|nr:hypothetical protein [Naasia sp. SYSU D00948]